MPYPPFAAELGGLILVVVLVAAGTWALGRLDLHRTRRGHPPLGFASDRMLRDVRRQAGDAPPPEYVGGKVRLIEDREGDR